MFNPNLLLPRHCQTGQIMRHTFAEPGTEDDKACIDRGIYTREPNYKFEAMLSFVAFDSDRGHTFVTLFNYVDRQNYYMSLQDFKEVLKRRAYDADTMTISGRFYFIKNTNNFYTIMLDEKNPAAPRSVSVKTPDGGVIRATVSSDTDNPGIHVTYLTPEGKEQGSVLFEHTQADNRLNAIVWSPDNPDGDPAQTIDMSKSE